MKEIRGPLGGIVPCDAEGFPGIYEYVETNRRTLGGQIVFAAYMLGEFVGYRIRRSDRDIERYRREAYGGNAYVNVNRWVEVYESYTIERPARKSA